MFTQYISRIMDFEREVDQMVYEVYGLTNEEIRAVEAEVK